MLAEDGVLWGSWVVKGGGDGGSGTAEREQRGMWTGD